MTLLNTQQRYGSLSISLHWLTFVCMVVAYASMELLDLTPRGSDLRLVVRSIHFCSGGLILVFALIRLGLMRRGPIPAITPTPSARQAQLARLGHLALYGLMLGLPVLGWLILSARGRAVPLFLFELPLLPLPDTLINRETAHQIKEIHGLLANIGYGLIGLHAVAALLHHYVQRDDTLLRMLPQRGRSR